MKHVYFPTNNTPYNAHIYIYISIDTYRTQSIGWTALDIFYTPRNSSTIDLQEGLIKLPLQRPPVNVAAIASGDPLPIPEQEHMTMYVRIAKAADADTAAAMGVDPAVTQHLYKYPRGLRPDSADDRKPKRRQRRDRDDDRGRRDKEQPPRREPSRRPKPKPKKEESDDEDDEDKKSVSSVSSAGSASGSDMDKASQLSDDAGGVGIMVKSLSLPEDIEGAQYVKVAVFLDERDAPGGDKSAAGVWMSEINDELEGGEAENKGLDFDVGERWLFNENNVFQNIPRDREDAVAVFSVMVEAEEDDEEDELIAWGMKHIYQQVIIAL